MLAASAVNTIATLSVFRAEIRELRFGASVIRRGIMTAGVQVVAGLSAAMPLTAGCFSGAQTFSTCVLLEQRAMLACMSLPLRGLYGGTFA
jgi:hypothetical protein